MKKMPLMNKMLHMTGRVKRLHLIYTYFMSACILIAVKISVFVIAKSLARSFMNSAITFVKGLYHFKFTGPKRT